LHRFGLLPADRRRSRSHWCRRQETEPDGEARSSKRGGAKALQRTSSGSCVRVPMLPVGLHDPSLTAT
jgi:hypothetical protein